MIPPPTPKRPAIKPEKKPVNKKVIPKIINRKSILFIVIIM